MAAVGVAENQANPQSDNQAEREQEAVESLQQLTDGFQEPVVCRNDFYRKLVGHYAVHPLFKPWSREFLQRAIEDLRGIRDDAHFKKSRHHYDLLRRYQLLQTADDQYSVIIKTSSSSGSPRHVVAYEDIYDILHDLHIQMGHSRRDKMMPVIRKKYHIPRICCLTFLELCRVCAGKKNSYRKPIWPVCLPKGVGVELNARPPEEDLIGHGQVDVVDMSSFQSDGEFKFLLRYEDLGTKFLSLRPLKSTKPAVVAGKLLKMFLHLGAPKILKSSSGGYGFVCSLLSVLQREWPSCKIDNGHSKRAKTAESFQAMAEQLQKQLLEWMQENNCPKWSTASLFVQWQSNNSFYSPLTRSPYVTKFATIPKSGLRKMLPRKEKPDKKPRVRKPRIRKPRYKTGDNKTASTIRKPRKSRKPSPAVADSETTIAVEVLDAVREAMSVGELHGIIVEENTDVGQQSYIIVMDVGENTEV